MSSMYAKIRADEKTKKEIDAQEDCIRLSEDLIQYLEQKGHKRKKNGNGKRNKENDAELQV